MFGDPDPYVPIKDPPPSPNISSFDGGSNPNTSFNPGAGQDDQGTQNFTSGGDSNPSTSLANSAPNATAPQNTEYQTWTWEQILNTTLGMSMPSRDSITNGRWTGIDTSVDSGLFQILGIEWWEGYDSHSAYVYLSPEFTIDSTSSESPWLVFQQGPGQLLGTFTATSGSFGLTTGPYGLDTPDTSQLALDPAQFGPVAQALMDAEQFYMNAMDTLSFIAQGLTGNANQFQGEAGGAFAQLMQDFSQQASYAQGQMGVSSDLGLPGQTDKSYSGLVLQAGQAAGDYLLGIWNAWSGWTQLLPHTPLGAILQAMIDYGIVTGSAGNWSIPKNLNLLNFDVAGVGNLNLASDASWQTIENQAKNVWENLTLVPVLDVPAQKALFALINGYYNAADNLTPLDAPTPTQIDSGVGGGGPNGGTIFPNNLFPNNLFGDLFPNNLFGDLFPNNLFGDLIPNNLFGDVFPNNLFGDLIPNNLFGDVFPNNLFNGSNFGGGGPNGSIGGLGSPNSSVTTFDAGPNQFVPPNPVTTFSATPNQFVSSTGPNQLVPQTVPPNPVTTFGTIPNQFVSSTGPNQFVPPNPVTTFTAGPNQSTPTGTVGSTTSELSALEQALDGNAQTQDALQSALTSGQVPPGSTLAKNLNTALNDSNKTQAALQQAEGAGNATNSALQSALTDNAGTQAALNQALGSGQVPPGSALQGTLNTALNGANQTQASLNQAVSAGASPSTQASAIRSALGDNSQTQHELSTALQSGQVPASSPLHSTVQSALTDAGKTQAAINQALKSSTGTTTASLDQAMKDNQATQNALNTALASGQVPASGPLRNDLNQALADTKQTGAALQQALAQQGIQSEPSIGALTSAVGVPALASTGPGLGSTPLLSASLPPTSVTAPAGPVSSGAFTAPGAQTTASSSEDPFPMYSPMAGGGMMGGQGQGQGQGQERERSTWLAEDEDIWGTDPEVGPRVLGRGYTDDEEPEEYDGYTERPERSTRKRPPARRTPGR
ncbi:MAG TPA: hypothetical protein VIZ43_30385 [Trebonia sp.]